MKTCVLCHERAAQVPDRERMGRPIKRVCRECHSGRLREDLAKIMKAREKNQELKP